MKDLRNLNTVCALLSSPGEMKAAIAKMCASDAWGGLLARLGHQLTNFTGEELGSTLTTPNRHLRFLNTPPILESFGSSSFDPAELLGGRASVYFVMPTEYLATQAGTLRLWISSFLRASVKGGAQERNKVLYVVDEAASLGHLPAIDNAIDKLRGYGVRLLMVYQSLGQLKQCFPDGRDQVFLANMDLQVYAGLKDFESAQAVSQRLGTATVQIVSHNLGSGTSTSVDHMGQRSRGRSSNDGVTLSETAREIYKPDELMALGERQAIVCAPGVRPFQTTLVRYYEREFDTAPGVRPFRQALGLVARSVGFLAFCALMSAAVLALAFGLVTGEPAAPHTAPAPVIQERPPAWPAP